MSDPGWGQWGMRGRRRCAWGLSVSHGMAPPGAGGAAWGRRAPVAPVSAAPPGRRNLQPCQSMPRLPHLPQCPANMQIPAASSSAQPKKNPGGFTSARSRLPREAARAAEVKHGGRRGALHLAFTPHNPRGAAARQEGPGRFWASTAAPAAKSRPGGASEAEGSGGRLRLARMAEGPGDPVGESKERACESRPDRVLESGRGGRRAKADGLATSEVERRRGMPRCRRVCGRRPARAPAPRRGCGQQPQQTTAVDHACGGQASDGVPQNANLDSAMAGQDGGKRCRRDLPTHRSPTSGDQSSRGGSGESPCSVRQPTPAVMAAGRRKGCDLRGCHDKRSRMWTLSSRFPGRGALR